MVDDPVKNRHVFVQFKALFMCNLCVIYAFFIIKNSKNVLLARFARSHDIGAPVVPQ